MDVDTLYQKLHRNFDAPYLELLWATYMPPVMAAISQSVDEAGRVITLVIQNPNIDRRSLHRIMGDFILFIEGDIIATCQQLFNIAEYSLYEQGDYMRIISFYEHVQNVITASGREDAIPEVTHLLNYIGTKFVDVLGCINVIMRGVGAGKFTLKIAPKILEKVQVFLVQSVLGPIRRVHDLTSENDFVEAISWPNDEEIPMLDYPDEVLEKIWLGQ